MCIQEEINFTIVQTQLHLQQQFTFAMVQTRTGLQEANHNSAQ